MCMCARVSPTHATAHVCVYLQPMQQRALCLSYVRILTMCLSEHCICKQDVWKRKRMGSKQRVHEVFSYIRTHARACAPTHTFSRTHTRTITRKWTYTHRTDFHQEQKMILRNEHFCGRLPIWSTRGLASSKITKDLQNFHLQIMSCTYPKFW